MSTYQPAGYRDDPPARFNLSPFAAIPFVDIFFAAFGGGASAPIFPPRYYKKSHAPACIFIGAGVGLCADNSHPDYPTGLTDVAYNQSPSPSPSPNPGFNHPFHGRYCGPGNLPGSPIDPTNKCCQQHDACCRSGLSGGDVLLHPFGLFAGSKQKACDAQLCSCDEGLGLQDLNGLGEEITRYGIFGAFCYPQ